MAPIQVHSKLTIVCNLRRMCRIITLMILSTSVLVLFPTMSNVTPWISVRLQITNISVVNHSSIETFYPNIAVLVEFRSVDRLVTVVHNVNRHIPSSWPIQIFHGNNNEYFIRNSTLAPFIASGKVLLTLLKEVYAKNRTNELLTTPAFWKSVRGEKILLFQIDSAMCSNSPHRITDFLKYDYIGAPWDPSWYGGDERYTVGNGGFSLRTRSKILELLALVPYNRRKPEDVWYAQNMHKVKGLIPSVEIAKTFAVESSFYDRPVGVHRFSWNCEFQTKLAETCPESMLFMSNVC